MITWIYPERCPVCLQIVKPKGAMVHPECKQKIKVIEEPFCFKCGMPLSSEEKEYCEVCLQQKDRGWDAGRSVFAYHASVGNALRLIKKDGRKEFVNFFIKHMVQSHYAFIQQVKPECIVPVPLHPSRKRQRGFNQSELLAKALEQEVQIPVCLLLKKNKRTKDQKSLSRNQRKKNVEDAFSVDEEILEKKVPESVLLLDDVTTTGSTLTACARALKARGVRQITFLTVCVAVQPE